MQCVVLTLAELFVAVVMLFLIMAQWNQDMEKSSIRSREWAAQDSNRMS